MSEGANRLASSTTWVDSAFWGSQAEESFCWALFSLPASGPATATTTIQKARTTHLVQRPHGRAAIRRAQFMTPPSRHIPHRRPPFDRTGKQVNPNLGHSYILAPRQPPTAPRRGGSGARSATGALQDWFTWSSWSRSSTGRRSRPALTFTLVSGSTVASGRRTDAHRGTRQAVGHQRPLDPVLRAAGPDGVPPRPERLPQLQRGPLAARRRDPLVARQRVRSRGDPPVPGLPARRHPDPAGVPRWYRRLPAQAGRAGLADRGAAVAPRPGRTGAAPPGSRRGAGQGGNRMITDQRVLTV